MKETICDLVNAYCWYKQQIHLLMTTQKEPKEFQAFRADGSKASIEQLQWKVLVVSYTILTWQWESKEFEVE